MVGDAAGGGAGGEVAAADRPKARSAVRHATSSPWRGIWALAFVGATLIALVAVPAYFGGEVVEVQARIADVLEPAARHSSNLELLLSRQMARMDGFLLTGDRATFREPYIATIQQKDTRLLAIQDLAGQLAEDERDEVFERVAALVATWARWDYENTQTFEDGPQPGDRERVLLGFSALEQSTRELNRTIQSVVESGRRDMADAAELQNRLTLVLAFCALFGTLLVGRVGYRYRELMREREAGRRDAVRARREIDSLLEATGDGVLAIDLDGRCTALNRAGCQLLGYTESEIEGRDVHDTLFHSLPDGTPSPRGSSPILEALAAGEPLDSGSDAILWRRKRQPFPARWSLRPRVDGIELRGAVLTFTDMTEIREKETALRRAIRQREDVVSVVSHDLRNPLGVVLAAADLLIDLPLDEQQRTRQAQIIARSGRRMHNLIDDLLDVARIEEGAFVVRPSLEELHPIVEEVAHMFDDQAERKQIDLVVRPGGACEARLDRDRAVQALANLLDNAIRLTPEGGCVTLSVEDEGHHAVVSVADTGPGIEPEMLEHLFDRFHQATGVGRGGAGLGLAIVHGVAVAHGGSVEVDSRLGAGTTFRLLFPKGGPPVGEDGAGDAAGSAAEPAAGTNGATDPDALTRIAVAERGRTEAGPLLGGEGDRARATGREGRPGS